MNRALKSSWAVRFSFLFLLLFFPLGTTAADVALPKVLLERAHAHNDYAHPRPLLDALENGFCGVEADIHLVNGELLVAHDTDQVRAGRTLQKLYLDPLREVVKKNRARFYPHGPGITLLVDIKTEATPTYQALRTVLSHYEDILTAFEKATVHTNAVTVIISGARPRELMMAEKRRLAAYDGRLVDLDGHYSPGFMPLISDNWKTHFKWTGEGPLPEQERAKLKDLVTRVRVQGKKIRFWAMPDNEAGWREMYEAGVDLINTDDLEGLSGFLNKTSR